MSPRKVTDDMDLARGERFAEVCENAFATTNRSAQARELGHSEARLRKWEKGATIDNNVLATLAGCGVDIIYLLTGQRQRRGVPHSPMRVARQQAELIEVLRILDEDIARRETAIRALFDAMEKDNEARRAIMDKPALAGRVLADLALKEIEKSGGGGTKRKTPKRKN